MPVSNERGSMMPSLTALTDRDDAGSEQGHRPEPFNPQALLAATRERLANARTWERLVIEAEQRKHTEAI